MDTAVVKQKQNESTISHDHMKTTEDRSKKEKDGNSENRLAVNKIRMQERMHLTRREGTR